MDPPAILAKNSSSQKCYAVHWKVQNNVYGAAMASSEETLMWIAIMQQLYTSIYTVYVTEFDNTRLLMIKFYEFEG